MQKITRKDIYGAFILLCNQMDVCCFISDKDLNSFTKDNPYFPKPKTRLYEGHKEGCLQLHYSPYGGWYIEIQSEKPYCSSSIFDHARRSNREFYNTLHYARHVLEFMERGKK